MSDFNKPTLASDKNTVLDELRDMIFSVAKRFSGTTDVGIAEGFSRLSLENRREEVWNGTAWVPPFATWEIDVRSVGGETLDEIKAGMAPAGYVPDGMVTTGDLDQYDTSAQVDAKIAAIETGSDGTDHTHDQYVTSAALGAYATSAGVTLLIDGIEVRLDALESKNFDDRYPTKEEADGKYQPKGEYLTTADAVTRSEVYLKGEVDSKFLDKEESLNTALADKMAVDAGLADLSDVDPTPNTVVGFDGDGNAVERAVADVSGAKTMTELTDAPDTYTGNAGKMLLVKEDETGVEFTDREASWNVITDELQFYGTSWELDGGEWAWRKQVGQYQFRGKVGIDNIGAGWYQFATTGNVSIPEASGQIVAVPAQKHDGTMTMAMARFWSATQIDIYIPEAIALNETIWFDFAGVVLNT